MCGMVQEAGKYLFPDEASQTALDDNWEHTQLRVVRGKVTDFAFLSHQTTVRSVVYFNAS
jgi:hypothetical protein